MNFREHEKGGNLFSAIEHQQKMTKHTVGVLKRASTHDSQIFEELLAKKDQAILAESAYKSEKNEPVMLDHNLEEVIITQC